MTAFKLNSAPVPAIVTIDPYGRPSVARTFLQITSHTSASVFAPTTIALTQSITLPPPTANTKSTSCSLHNSMPLLTVPSLGFGSTPDNSTHSICASLNKAITSSSTPFFLILPPPSTSSTLSNDFHSFGNQLICLFPNTIFVL